MRTFLDILGFSPLVVFDNNGSSGGGGGGGGGGSSDSGGSSGSSGGSNTTTVPVYDNYYDAIDAEGVGATVNIGGKIVKAETKDGYTGSSNTSTKPKPNPSTNTNTNTSTNKNKKSNKKSDKDVKVKKGDSLSKIAEDNNTSVAAIVAANPEITNVNNINVGQDLVVPTNTGEATYTAGIGASGSGKVTRNDNGTISVETGTKESTELIPVATGGIEPITTTVNTTDAVVYNPTADNTVKTGAKTPGSTAKVPPKDGGDKKPNALGYGYYNQQGVWIPPDIDMIDGGGKGIAGAVFGSSGGVEADKYPYGNGDGYVTKLEAEAAAKAGVFKYGIGAASNAVGATPYGSGIDPTGIAGAIHGEAMEDPLFGPGVSMTQEQVDEYMADVTKRSQEAMEQQQKIINEGDGGASVTEVVEPPKPECPEGYKYSEEEKQCVIDPFQTPFPDPVQPPGYFPMPPGQQPAGLTPYTQMGPVTLGQLTPSRVANVPQRQGGLGALAPILPGTNRVS